MKPIALETIYSNRDKNSKLKLKNKWKERIYLGKEKYDNSFDIDSKWYQS